MSLRAIIDRVFPSRVRNREIAQAIQDIRERMVIQNEQIDRSLRQLLHTIEVQSQHNNEATLRGQIEQATRTVAELTTEARSLKAIVSIAGETMKRLERIDDRLIATSSIAPPESNALLNRLAEAQLWLEKISSESGNAFVHLDGAITGARGDLSGLTNQVAEVRLWLEKISTETGNAAAHLDGRIVTAINTLFNERLPQIVEQSHAAAALILELRAQAIDRSRWHTFANERYQPAKAQEFDRVLQRLADDFPLVSSAWRERLETVRREFSVTKTGNAANAGDVYSRMFKSFVEIHTFGRVLDVGPGVFGRPYYLSAYPHELISGIEPLELVERADFECVRGISEYLPWPDDSFSTVVNATSLDHSASLTKSLDEMLRVLRADGVLLLWIGSEPGSPEFDPQAPDFARSDQFHLFHFDVAWFEPRIAKQWSIIDRMEFPTPTFSHVFYALRPMKSPPANQ
jgi:SAM-dependent methyltransferase